MLCKGRAPGSWGKEGFGLIVMGTDNSGLGRASQAEGKARVKAQRTRNAGAGTRDAAWCALSGRSRLEDEQEKVKSWDIGWDPS